MSAPTRVALVGAGYVSAHHLRALQALPFLKVVGICDPDAARAEAMARKFGVEKTYPNLAAMRAAKPDVIHILTPPASHCALTLEALEMGCHVFVEKPMAESAAECDQMIAKACEKGLVLSVNHSDRFDPVVLEAMELARSGACGDVLAVHSIRSSEYPPYAGGPLPAPYRQGSYPFRDLGVHSLYLVECFLGPVQHLNVRYHQTGRDPLLTFDEWRADVECEKGTGYLYLSWNTRPIQSELMIHGTKGVIHVDRFLQICEINRTLPGPKQIGVIINGFRNSLRKTWKVPLNLMRFVTGSLKPSPGIFRSVQDFHKALAKQAPVPVPPEEGRRIMTWVETAGADADLEKQEMLAEALAGPLQPARILVTGAGGFLGRALVEKLREQGETVRVFLRRPPATGPAPEPGTVCYGSLGHPETVARAVEGVEVVYHVGAAMKGGKEEFEQGTIWGTRNIVDACLRHKVKRLVYVSSMGVLDHAGRVAGKPLTESYAFEPFPERRGAYTQTKLQAEQMVAAAIRDKGLPAVIVRPGQIFGPGAERVTPNGVIGIAGKWIVAGMGKRSLPLVYRDDVVDALLLAEHSDKALGKVVHIVDSYKIDQNEYLRQARPALDGIGILRLPVPVLMLLASGIEMLGAVLKRGVPLTRYRIRSLNPLAGFDQTGAWELLGWKPQVGVEEGMRRTFGTARK